MELIVVIGGKALSISSLSLVTAQRSSSSISSGSTRWLGSKPSRLPRQYRAVLRNFR